MPRQMCGCVFLESMPPNATSRDDNSTLPPICISKDTSRFRYTYRGGLQSTIRVARVILETVAHNHSNVRWYVFGDDDTMFFPENLAKTHSKYDYRLCYYVGAGSEIYEQKKVFSFGMAFGGAGFAISYPLAKVLAKVLNSCIDRYPHLYGSDSRVYSCLTELGVGLTREPGFHQFDVWGNAFRLLAAHPLTPLVSFHHIDQMDPIFPNMTRIKAMEHLLQVANVDSQRILQRTVCYDHWFSWTISVSWGYAVQVYGKHIYLPDAALKMDNGWPKFAGYLSDDGSPRQKGKTDLSVFKNVVEDYLDYEPKQVDKPVKSKPNSSNDLQMEKFSGLRISLSFSSVLRNQLVSPAEFSERLSDIRFVRLTAIKNFLVGDTLWMLGNCGSVDGKGTIAYGKLGVQMKMLFLFSCLLTLISSTARSRLEEFLHCSVAQYAKMPRYQLVACAPNQILKIGTSADYGVCKGKRKDGTACTLESQASTASNSGITGALLL
ncbi:Protein of unknown function DUF604 - like 2, partial [Theobroma cacao]